LLVVAQTRMGACWGSSEKATLDSLYDVDPTVIGKGQYAEVMMAKHRKTGRDVAVKRIDKKHSKPQNLEVEISILKNFGHHRHIVRLYDVFEDEENLNIVIEFCDGGELFDALVENGPYTEQDSCKWMRHIGSALQYLHSKGVVHRDLKPENLLLTNRNPRDGELKIGDFGLSKILKEDNLMHLACGTWAYCAPEVLEVRRKRRGDYTSKCDCFSVGVILFVILAGYHPFDPLGKNSDRKMQELIMQGAWDFDDPAWESVSDKAKDLVSKLMEHDPAKRFSATEMLMHPWVKGTVLRGKLSSTIDKQLSKFQDDMHKKFKKHLVATHSAMTFKKMGSVHLSKRQLVEDSNESSGVSLTPRLNADPQVANPVAVVVDVPKM